MPEEMLLRYCRVLAVNTMGSHEKQHPGVCGCCYALEFDFIGV
jgi:hypothetical protein